MSENIYKTEIKFSNRVLTARERVKLKDVSDAIKLDNILEQENEIIIDVDLYAELLVKNSKSEKGEYPLYIIVDTNGEKYCTGSNPFWSSFNNIIDELADEGEELKGIKVYKKDSKNYAGKKFITCGLE